MKKKIWLAAAALAAMSLCGCTGGSIESVLSSEPESVLVSETVSEAESEIASDEGWTKPSGGNKENDVKDQGKEISYSFDFEAHNPNEWQRAYYEFLQDLNPAGADGSEEEDPLITNANEYFLADVEDRYSQYDPELCVKKGTCEADYQLLIYDYNPNTGKVEELVGPDEIYAGHATFYVGPDGNLYSYAGHMGYLWVQKYTGLADKVKTETIYEEDINGKEDADYKSMSEIIGEQIEPVMMVPASNEAPLLWYLNVPVATASEDKDAADVAITAALYDNAEVYVVGTNQYYDGVTGLVPFHDLKKPGALDSYSDREYVLNVYCYTDVNFDGQDEMLIRLATDERDKNGDYYYSYVLLSYQDGVVYAYAFPYLTYGDQFLDVCEFDVYHNWYDSDYDCYYGFVFDKDKCLLTYSNDYESETKPQDAESNVWKTFRVDFGY